MVFNFACSAFISASIRLYSFGSVTFFNDCCLRAMAASIASTEPSIIVSVVFMPIDSNAFRSSSEN